MKSEEVLLVAVVVWRLQTYILLPKNKQRSESTGGRFQEQGRPLVGSLCTCLGALVPGGSRVPMAAACLYGPVLRPE